jgi:hypothetical protein
VKKVRIDYHNSVSAHRFWRGAKNDDFTRCVRCALTTRKWTKCPSIWRNYERCR